MIESLDKITWYQGCISLWMSQENCLYKTTLNFNNPIFSDHVCLLHKSFYSLKQVSRVWFDRLSRYLLTFGSFYK